MPPPPPRTGQGSHQGAWCLPQLSHSMKSGLIRWGCSTRVCLPGQGPSGPGRPPRPGSLCLGMGTNMCLCECADVSQCEQASHDASAECANRSHVHAISKCPLLQAGKQHMVQQSENAAASVPLRGSGPPQLAEALSDGLTQCTAVAAAGLPSV